MGHLYLKSTLFRLFWLKTRHFSLKTPKWRISMYGESLQISAKLSKTPDIFLNIGNCRTYCLWIQWNWDQNAILLTAVCKSHVKNILKICAIRKIKYEIYSSINWVILRVTEYFCYDFKAPKSIKIWRNVKMYGDSLRIKKDHLGLFYGKKWKFRYYKKVTFYIFSAKTLGLLSPIWTQFSLINREEIIFAEI